MKKIMMLLFALVCLGLQAQEVLKEISGLEKPESALFWPEKNLWIVSNVGPGTATEKTSRGYLALVSGEGTVEKWVTNLNAPKGLAWHQGRLYVADVDRVVEIDPSGPTFRQIVDIPGARFLNDLTSTPLGVMASDTQTGSLWLISEEEPKLWFQSPQLGSPNGLFWVEGFLYLTQFRGTTGAGQFLKISPEKNIQRISSLQGALDGSVYLGEKGWILSDYNAGKVFLLHGETLQVFWAGKKGTADLGLSVDGKVLAVPNMEKGLLTLIKIL